MPKQRTQRRLNAAEALERLTRRNGLTNREMIEKLLIQADWAVWKTLEVGTDDYREYFDEPPQLPRVHH